MNDRRREVSSRSSRLIEAWRTASHDLGIVVETPFTLVLASGGRIDADVLVKDFGSPQGMLLSTDPGVFHAFDKEIVSAGYGYSALVSPVYESYDPHVFMEVLNHWSWAGTEEDRPTWSTD